MAPNAKTSIEHTAVKLRGIAVTFYLIVDYADEAGRPQRGLWVPSPSGGYQRDRVA